MPFVRCLLAHPSDFLVPGAVYEVRIGDADVRYQRVGPDGISREPVQYGPRWVYRKRIESGALVLLPPASAVRSVLWDAPVRVRNTAAVPA